MVATTTATTAGTAAAVGASSAAAAGTTAGVSAGVAAGAGTAAGVGAAGATGAGIAAGTTGATTAGLSTAGTAATVGTAGAGTTAASAGFGSWLHSMLFGEAASTGASTAGTVGASGATAGTTQASTGMVAAGTGQAAAGTAATEGLIGAGGEYSTKSLLANAMTGASAASAVMSGISSSRQMKASQKQTEIQYHQEKNQALQKSNLIREAMLKDVASARATYASRGFTDDGTPSQVMNESANQANSDIGVVKTDSQIAGLQLRAQGQEYRRGAAFSLLSGFGNGAGIVGNRILTK